MALHGAGLRGATPSWNTLSSMAHKSMRRRSRITLLDVAMGKSIVAQLPYPESTVALLRKLGGLEGKDAN
jgi:hypothetical protein